MSITKEDITIHVEVCKEGVILPSYANIGDAGMDIRAAEDILINPGETKIVPSGLKMAIPSGYELQVRPRSGLSFKTPLRIANTPGTIDSGYRDEIGLIVNNSSPLLAYDVNQEKDTKEITFKTPAYPQYSIEEKGNKFGSYLIKKGDRIAQIVLSKFETIDFNIVESGELNNIGINRGGGYGSSGTN